VDCALKTYSGMGLAIPGKRMLSDHQAVRDSVSSMHGQHHSVGADHRELPVSGSQGVTSYQLALLERIAGSYQLSVSSTFQNKT